MSYHSRPVPRIRWNSVEQQISVIEARPGYVNLRVVSGTYIEFHGFRGTDNNTTVNFVLRGQEHAHVVLVAISVDVCVLWRVAHATAVRYHEDATAVRKRSDICGKRPPYIYIYICIAFFAVSNFCAALPSHPCSSHHLRA